MEALNKGGNLPCVMNAANEIAVYAFLRNRINFLDMTDVIEKTMQKVTFMRSPHWKNILKVMARPVILLPILLNYNCSSPTNFSRILFLTKSNISATALKVCDI